MNRVLQQVRPARLILLLTITLFAGLFLLWQVVAGASACQVEVAVVGQLWTEAGHPASGQELLMRFYVSPGKPDVESTATTDKQGRFQFQVIVPQHIYNNAGFPSVEIQGRLYVKGYDGDLTYLPAGPMIMSEAGAYENWAEAGLYQDNIFLFHSIRMTNGSMAAAEFADMAIQLGSLAQPIQLTCGLVTNAPEFMLTVEHRQAETGKPVAEFEVYTYSANDLPAQQFTKPQSLPDQAPLRIELDGQIVAEAEGSNPLTGYEVPLPSSPSSDTSRWILTYYYHLDRDGDGIPDFEVKSRYRQANGNALPGQVETVELYAYKELYQGRAPAVSGYRYKGYELAEADLQTGIPVEIITTDMEFQYVYEKRSGGGSGNGGDTNGGNGSDNQDNGSANQDDGDDNQDKEGEDGNQEITPPVTPPPPEDIHPPDPEPEPDDSDGQGDMIETEKTVMTQTSPPSRSQPALTLGETEQKEPPSSIAFVKRSYQQQVAPGEIVTYGFHGFANNQPYAVQDFTLVDEPDRGLDLIAVALPAFQLGAEVQYDVVFTTNQRPERRLIRGQSAAVPFTADFPRLREGEHITELNIRFGEVPAGFAQGDEVQVVFQVWRDPPADELHNLGLLYYEDLGEVVSQQSADEPSVISVHKRESINEQLTAESQPARLTSESSAAAGFLTEGGKSPSKTILSSLLLILALVSVGFWAMRSGNREERP